MLSGFGIGRLDRRQPRQMHLQLRVLQIEGLQHPLPLRLGGSRCIQGDAIIQDMQTYQFGAFTCLCLRCGARFDATDP